MLNHHLPIKKSRIIARLPLILVGVFLISSCGWFGPIARARSESDSNFPVALSATPQEIRRSDGTTLLVRDGGWPIPSFDGAERKVSDVLIESADGIMVTVYRTDIQVDPLSLVAQNPLHSIGIGYEMIRINRVMEFRTFAGIFCYKFLVNDADVDKATNKIRSTRGFLYDLAFYDEDGDGAFESLIIGEKDSTGKKGFGSKPHLPDWSIAQIRKKE